MDSQIYDSNEWLAGALSSFVFVLVGINVTLLAVNIFLIWSRRLNNDAKHRREGTIKLLCVIGSGGHTTEILKLISGIGNHYVPRIYVLSDTDNMGQQKVIEFENNRHKGGENRESNFFMCRIPRSREVKQSYATAIFTTIHATIYSLNILLNNRPDVVLCNGPGTGLPICMLAAVLSTLRILRTKVIFVESICRVRTLSLTGRILYTARLADCFFVQWPELQAVYPRAKYIGRLL